MSGEGWGMKVKLLGGWWPLKVKQINFYVKIIYNFFARNWNSKDNLHFFFYWLMSRSISSMLLFLSEKPHQVDQWFRSGSALCEGCWIWILEAQKANTFYWENLPNSMPEQEAKLFMGGLLNPEPNEAQDRSSVRIRTIKYADLPTFQNLINK